MSHIAHVTEQQMDVYNFFKKFAKQKGRLPNANEIIKGMNLANHSQALYWAGCILLKGGFGLKVADDNVAPGIVSFGDFKFPMHNDAPVTVQTAPVAQSVIQANPQPAAAASDDMPKAFRNLTQRVEKIQNTQSRTDIMKRDVLSVMDQLKKYGISVKLNNRLLTDTMQDLGKRYTVKQIAWAVNKLLDEKKLNGNSWSFTYL